MVLVAERLEGGPVSSRVSTFPDVFSMAEGWIEMHAGWQKTKGLMETGAWRVW